MTTRQPAAGPVTRLVLLAVFGGIVGSGCIGGPFFAIPGGRLSGEVVREAPSDWSFLDAPWLELETRPDDPYSVQLGYVVRDGKLYIDAAEGRTWLDHLRADPRVRVRVGGRVYELRAVQVGRPGELPGFDPSRLVYRLEPRRAAGRRRPARRLRARSRRRP